MSLANEDSRPLNRACEQCRTSKIRCLTDSDLPGNQCRRCFETQRTCTFAVQKKRRPRIRTDTRVKDLEVKLKAVQNLMNERNIGDLDLRKTIDTPSVSTGVRVDMSASNLLQNLSSQSQANHVAIHESEIIAAPGVPGEELDVSAQPPTPSRDVIDQQIVSLKLSEDLFELFVSRFASQFPIVSFGPELTFDNIRREKPTLLLSILAAASATCSPKLFQKLNMELLEVFARKVVLGGQKSLELVQAMLIMAFWYFPPDRFDKLAHYRYIHLAAVMAVELGIGDNSWQVKVQTAISKDFDDSNVLDECRIWLACFLLCSGVAMNADRPNMLLFSNSMQLAIDVLRSCSTATTRDQQLSAWVELQLISDEVTDHFRRPALSGFFFDNPTVQQRIRNLENRFDIWYSSVPEDVLSNSLRIQYHYQRSRVFETVLYGDHLVSDFRPPHAIRTSQQSLSRFCITPASVKTIFNLIHSSQAIVEQFLKLTTLQIVTAPIITHIRVCYALVVLVKLDLDARRSSHELSKILDRDMLKVDQYLTRLCALLSKTAGNLRLRVPERFLATTQRLKDWWFSTTSKAGEDSETKSCFQPLVDLTIPPSTTVNLLTTLREENIMSHSINHQDTISVSQDSSVATPASDFRVLDRSKQNLMGEASDSYETILHNESPLLLPMDFDSTFFEDMSNDIANSMVPELNVFDNNSYFSFDAG